MAFGKSLVETGVSYLTKGQYDQATECYDEAIRLDPKNSDLFALRRSAYGSKGQYDQAKHGFPFSERGKAYLSIGDYDRAIVDYTQAIRLDPKHVDPFVGRGKAYEKQGYYDQAIAGQYDRAITDLDQALKLDPVPWRPKAAPRSLRRKMN